MVVMLVLYNYLLNGTKFGLLGWNIARRRPYSKIPAQLGVTPQATDMYSIVTGIIANNTHLHSTTKC
jgi:hypothetical protein